MLRNTLLQTSAETRVQQNHREEPEGSGLFRAIQRPWMNRLDDLQFLDFVDVESRLVERARWRANYLRGNQALRGYQAPGETKFYDLKDPTFKFVEREDEFDFLCEGFKSPRALMSCGHAVTPTSLTKWCQKLLDDGRTRFVCGQTSCNVEWSFKEVCRMALLTPQEKMHFEKALSSNADRRNTKLCPLCSSPVVRSDQSNLRVRCSVCRFNYRRIYDFCWQCMREWRGPDSRPDHCGNDDCCNESLKTLESCPEIPLVSVMCPSTRACPICGILLQHDNAGCNNVNCPRCKKEFCFVCLKLSDECLTNEEYIPCSVAPRQTSIPVWQKK